ncbi:MAG: hypothetical protein ACJATI_004786 [Halioglobus sp.]|jgi:hypothetical protein
MIKNKFYILCSIFFIFLFSCRDQSEPEVFLIPENYIGSIAILFNQSDGKGEEYEDGKIIYRISYDGILKTKFQKTSHGKLNQEYFYVNEKGIKITKLETYSHGDYDVNKKYIMNGEYGNFNNPDDLIDENRIHYILFSIGGVDNINYLKKKNTEFLEDVRMNLTKE